MGKGQVVEGYYGPPVLITISVAWMCEAAHNECWLNGQMLAVAGGCEWMLTEKNECLC